MGKYWNGIYVSDVNGKGMGTGIKSLTWEGFGTKKSIPAHLYIETLHCCKIAKHSYFRLDIWRYIGILLMLS
jgi:hypothetical protein